MRGQGPGPHGWPRARAGRRRDTAVARDQELVTLLKGGCCLVDAVVVRRGDAGCAPTRLEGYSSLDSARVL